MARGGLICKRPAISTADGRHIIALAASSVRLYSAVTGELAQDLFHDSEEVTGAVLHPTSQMKVAPRDQQLVYFEEEYTNVTGKPLVHLRHFNLATEAVEAALYKMAHFAPLTASLGGEFMALVEGRTVSVWPSDAPTRKPLVLHHTKPFTCVAIDSANERVAAGDISGRILIWHGFQAGLASVAEGQKPSVACTTVHWHAQRVGCLCFSADANYLLSGGQEAVLVLWQLASGRRSFLPRLSGALFGIAPLGADPARIVITQRDNTLRTINLATFKVELSIHGLRPPPRAPPGRSALFPIAAALVPGNGALVLAGDNALLQFYDAAADRHLDKLQVAPRNTVSLNEEERSLYGPPAEPQVPFVVFSCDATIMATVDLRPDGGAGGSFSETLKFWDRTLEATGPSSAPSYTLSTQINDPHRGHITALAYHPSEHMAVTTGEEGDFRVWERHAVRGQGTAGWRWHCRSVGSYRGEALHAAAFSGDGSLLAVAAGDTVTLWQPVTNALLTTLSGPVACRDQPVSLLTFVPETPFLVGASRGRHPALVVWNLLTAGVWWSCNVLVTSLSADQAGGRFAVGVVPEAKAAFSAASARGTVALFDPARPDPIQAWYMPRSWAAAVLFVPPGTPLAASVASRPSPDTSALLLIAHNRELALVAHPAPAQGKETAEEMGSPLEEVEATSRFEANFGAAAASRASAGANGAIAGKEEKDWAPLFDAQSHVLPPPSVLAPAFLEMIAAGGREPSD